jgi:hypothetical protein
MLHMYLMVSLFSIFSMEPVNIPSIGYQFDVEMEFTSVPSVHIGDPVLYKGAVVGNVSRIHSASSEDVSAENAPVRVNIRLNSASVPLGQELIGLVSSMKLPSASGASSRSFLDLMHFADINGSEKVNASGEALSRDTLKLLKGFSSFQEFWSTTSL